MSKGSITEINTTKIVMVGPSRIGKTSMLASMYNVLKKDERDSANHRYRMNAVTSSPGYDDIIDKADQLEAVFCGDGLVVDRHVEGTSDPRVYDFEFNIDGKYKMPLEFVDVPGGWYTGRECDKAKAKLEDSHVSLLVVDTPALMESKGKYHRKFNAVNRIQDLYDATEFQHKHTVVLVLVRAESYIERCGDLKSRVNDEYKELAKVLNQKGIKLTACCVKTMGGLFFNNYVMGNDEASSQTPVACFRKDKKIGYQPEYCDLPLRLIAKHGMKIVIEETQEKIIREAEGFWADLLKWFGLDWTRRELEKTLSVYTETVKSISEKLKDHKDKLVFPVNP